MVVKRSVGLLKLFLARQYAKLYPSEMFIGVTGAVGNAGCVTACSAVLSRKYQTLTTKLNIDPAVNIPATIFKIRPRVKKVVLEMAAEQPGQISACLSLVKPKVAVVTQLSGIHQEAKELIDGLGQDGIAIFNWDDPNSRKLAEGYTGTVLYYGMNPQHCIIWAGNLQIENFTTTFELNLGVERIKVNFKLLGLHQVYPALAAALLGVVCQIPLTQIRLGLESIEPKEHEPQAIFGPNGSILLDDTYNGSFSALDGAIETLLVVPARRRIVVLGEMKDLGNDSEKLYRSMAQKIDKEKLDFVFLGQGDIQIIAEELQSLGFWAERLEYNLPNSQLVATLLQTLGKGDVCLLSGSKAVRLDEVVKRIAKK